MTRRFEVGPMLVALGALALIISLFLDWYGTFTAWEAFEVVEVLLAALAVAALVIAVGLLLPDLEFVERRWLPAVVLGVAVLVGAEIVDPPPVAAGETVGTGAWIAFGSAFAMFAGAILSFGRISLSVAVEGRDARERVAVVDQRQDTTESAAVAEPSSRSQRSRRAKD